MGTKNSNGVDDKGYKVVFLHGFSQDEMGRIMRGVKNVAEDPGKVAFCMSTDNNLDWKIRDLIEDVTEEHDYMKKNPPDLSDPPEKDKN